MTVGCPYYKLYGSYVTIKSDEKLLCLASPEKAAWRRSRRRKTWLKSARKKTKRSQLLIESWRQTQRMKCAGKWHWCVSVWTLVMRVGFLFFFPVFLSFLSRSRPARITRELWWFTECRCDAAESRFLWTNLSLSAVKRKVGERFERLYLSHAVAATRFFPHPSDEFFGKSRPHRRDF